MSLFSKISVFHCLKFFSYDAYSLNPLDEVVTDSIHVDPAHVDKYGKVVPGRFDTAIIQIREARRPGLKGMFKLILSLQNLFVSHSGLCVGRIRCIFSLPPHAVAHWFPAENFPHKHFAYVEWFTPFSQAQRIQIPNYSRSLH